MKALLLLTALLSPTAFASTLTTLNLGSTRTLPECGGTVEAKASDNAGAADQVNFILRNVKNCSNFVLHSTGKQYKINGEDGNRTGSYTISAAKLEGGTNILRLTVRSNSGAHQDEILIPVRVVARPVAPISPLCGTDFCVGDEVLNIDRSNASARVLAVTADGKYVLQFLSGELAGQLGANWSGSALAKKSGCTADLCVGSYVFVLARLSFATVVGIQTDGRYVLRFDTGELAGQTGAKWSALDLTVIVK